MSFRFSFEISREKIKLKYNLPVKQELIKSYNIGPSDFAYVLSSVENFELKRFRWGLIPYWAKDPESGNHLTLAMAEGIESKDSFRIPIRQKRCIVFADSYYESNRINQKERYFRFLLKSQSPMAFAGIWNQWTDINGEEYYSFAIITTEASEDLKKEGWNRIPVIFTDENQIFEWLDDDKQLYNVLKMLRPLSENSIIHYQISDEVKDPNNDYPELHKEYIEEESEQH